MILDESAVIQEVQLAKLQFEDGHVRYFNSSEQVISYLRGRPDPKSSVLMRSEPARPFT